MNPKMRQVSLLVLALCLGLIVWQHIRSSHSYDGNGCADCTSPKKKAKFLADNGVVTAVSSPKTQDPTHPVAAHDWVETKLYFGLGPAEDTAKGTTEAQWRDFLDREVTPRFPSGLSVEDIYGQWQSKSKPAVEHIRSKMLVIDYAANAGNDAKIEAIRTAWKQKTGDQSVLKVTQPADVSF